MPLPYHELVDIAKKELHKKVPTNVDRIGPKDVPLTPSQERLKAKLMRQFMKTPEGPGGNSELYKRNYEKIDWSK